MPYYHVFDYEDYDEDAEEASDSAEEIQYDYESAQARFSRDDLFEHARVAYDVLRAMGVVAVRCHYDGGNDEGFAEFREANRGAEVLGVEALCQQLESGPLGDIPEENPLFPVSHFREMSRYERAKEALDNFAFALASRLLGEGYGTGEYTMYGDFRADLATGDIVDEQE